VNIPSKLQKPVEDSETERSDKAERLRREKALDQAIEDSFPASDPISTEQPAQVFNSQNR
jgi:hypothetical protein